jgi:hypothetical protein
MKAGYQLFSACLVALVGVGHQSRSAAAEGPVVAQDLLSVRASTGIAAALWTRRPDSYTLQIAFPSVTSHSEYFDRVSFFTGNTIANLRGVNPAAGRTLTLVDGRRVASGASPPDSSEAVEQPAPQKIVAEPPADTPDIKGPPDIQIWLLRADGTQVSPVAVATETSTAYGCKTNCPASGKQYRFPLLQGAQAVAVVISVDGVYYIEKLQSLEPAPLKQ